MRELHISLYCVFCGMKSLKPMREVDEKQEIKLLWPYIKKETNYYQLYKQNLLQFSLKCHQVILEFTGSHYRRSNFSAAYDTLIAARVIARIVS